MRLLLDIQRLFQFSFRFSEQGKVLLEDGREGVVGEAVDEVAVFDFRAAPVAEDVVIDNGPLPIAELGILVFRELLLELVEDGKGAFRVGGTVFGCLRRLCQNHAAHAGAIEHSRCQRVLRVRLREDHRPRDEVAERSRVNTPT